MKNGIDEDTYRIFVYAVLLCGNSVTKMIKKT